MKIIYALPLLLTVIGILSIQHPSAMSSQNRSLSSEDKKVCVIRNVVKPSVVQFKNSITLTQAIKETGGVSPDAKSSQVRIYRKLEGSKRMNIYVDLKAIEKGRAEDLSLENNDIVDVVPKDKKKRIPVIESDCAPCGCRIVRGMHGYVIDY